MPGLPKEEVTALANQYVKDKNSFKVDFPHLLYIQKGQEVRAPITKDLFDAFIKAFHTKLVKTLLLKEELKVNFVFYFCLFVCFCGRPLSKELGIPIGILPTSGAGVDGNAPYQDNPGIQTNFLPPRPVQS